MFRNQKSRKHFFWKLESRIGISFCAFYFSLHLRCLQLVVFVCSEYLLIRPSTTVSPQFYEWYISTISLQIVFPKW